MEPKTIGAVFWYVYRYPPSLRPPLLNRAGTCVEVEPPYRSGTSWLWRLPLTRWSLAVGRWRSRATGEDAALAQALSVRPLDADVEAVREWI